MIRAVALIAQMASLSPMAFAGEGQSIPESLGFRHLYKCPDDRDVLRLGDTGTAEACLAKCTAVSKKTGAVAGCWWLDGTGGFHRDCRVCRTRPPVKGKWPNDWALPFTGETVSLPSAPSQR